MNPTITAAIANEHQARLFADAASYRLRYDARHSGSPAGRHPGRRSLRAVGRWVHAGQL